MAPQVALARVHLDQGTAQCERTAVRHGFDRVETKIDKDLLQQAAVAEDAVIGGLQVGHDPDVARAASRVNQSKRAGEHLVQPDRLEGGVDGTGEVEQSVDDRINTFDLSGDERAGRGAEVGVVERPGEELDEGLDSDQGVFDFVCHAGGEGADAREAVGAAGALLETSLRGDVVQRRDGADAGAVGPQQGTGAEAYDVRLRIVIKAQFDFLRCRLFRQGATEGVAQRLRQVVQRGGRGGAGAEEAAGLAIHRGESAGGVAGDHAVGDVVQERFIVAARVVNFRVEPRVLDRKRELVAQVTEKNNVIRVINRAIQAGAEHEQMEFLPRAQCDRCNVSLGGLEGREEFAPVSTTQTPALDRIARYGCALLTKQLDQRM